MRVVLNLSMALLLLAGCALSDPLGDGPADLPVQVTLAPGEDARVDGILTVGFVEVVHEGRCPSDFACILPGNAAIRVHLTLGRGPTHPFVLNTNPLDGPAAVTFGGYRVTLLQLTPYPKDDRPIEHRDYRARFEIGPRE